MATQSKVVIYNPTTKQHEPLAAGDTLDASILPPSSGSTRKLWIGKADHAETFIHQGSNYGTPPDLVIGEKYFVWKGDAADDFSNVGQGVDESLVFTATGTTPNRWTNSIVYRLDSDVVVTEYYNTIGFVITPSLRIIDGTVDVIFTTSAPYWLNPLAIYNNGTVVPIDANVARVFQATTKVVLELI